MAMKEDEKELKVSDFRMFNPDGSLRPEYRDLENPPDAASEPKSEPPPPAAARARPEESRPQEEPPGEIETEFVELVNSLAASAMAALGLLSEPGSRVSPDLAAARRMIDWLAALEHKTRGNLSFAEQNVLSRALYELRLAYVKMSGAAETGRR
jgi:hypothetical protein